MSPLESRLREHVNVLAGLIGERNSRRPSALMATRAYISRNLTEMGISFTEHRYAVAAREAVNIVVEIAGNLPRKRCLVVGAHYDTAPMTPGADDNASAVAALLEIIAATKKAKFDRTLRCVFFDCEEPPHFGTRDMGSFQDAKELAGRGVRIYGMICLESIGYFPRRVEKRVQRPRFIRWIDSLLSGRHIVIVSDFKSISFGLPFVMRFLTSGFFLCVPAALPKSIGMGGLSDHSSYWHHGFRALMVTNTAMYRNPNYHTRYDLPDTLDYDRLAKLTLILTRVVLRICK